MRTRLLGGRYRLGPVIGEGGMSAVHRARDERLGRDVAVKVLRAGSDAADCERLRREVEYLGSVEHPNLVAVLDGGADGSDDREGGRGGVAWFAMELVAGPDLRTLLRDRGPLDGSAVRRLLVGVLGALGAMHEAGLVHRDVTPSNILLTAGPFARWEAKLTDLGIARRILSVPLTDAGRVVGTAAYLSPEQVLGGEVGPASDVYALALVAAEALTAVAPFPGSAVESATSRLLRPPALPADLAPEWRDLLLSAASLHPADRPDVAAFRAAALALPEDAGVRSDGGAPNVDAAVTASGDRSPGAARTRAMEVVERSSTAVLPAAPHTTAVTRAASTAEFATVPHRRTRSRVAVGLAASVAAIGVVAVVGAAALVAPRLLESSAGAQGALDSTPQPSQSASAAARPDDAAQADAGETDAGETDTDESGAAQVGPAAPTDAVVAPDEAAAEGPAVHQGAPGPVAAAPADGPGRAAGEADAPGAEAGAGVAVVGPGAP